ncbi:MAG: hypothetical protein KGN16_24030 [Burkholderiales bacterium]|nr:hypothetical protein [Burkholderiales bacterium]
MTVPVHLHQIAYSREVLSRIEPGYRVLDHLANERSDWYEYAPIRRYLLTQPLDDEAFYGFFSPKFGAKTGLGHDAVAAAVRAAAPQADVVLFSPQPDMGAFFLNVYEQGETFDAGFIAACEGWLRHAGRAVPLRSLVMDTRQVVFSNFFVARPAFWRVWLEWNETLWELCESGPAALRDPLVAPTSYPGAAQRKVFVQERTASLLLTLQPRWRSHPVNPFRMAWSASRFAQHPQLAVMSDALKRAHRDLGFPCYLQAYGQLRQRFVAAGASASMSV